MKKLMLLTTLSLLFFSCAKNESNASIESLIENKNVPELQAKKALLQADLAKIDNALTLLDVKKEEALVSVITVKDTLFNHYLEVQGNIDTKQNILVQPEFQGTLTALYVKAGQHVVKGQVLAKIDDAGLSQQVASLENQFALAKTTFERQKNLWDQKIGSEIQFLQAKTQMISAQRSVAQIKAQFTKTIVKAPFSGTIDAVFVEKGQVVAPSVQGLLRIVNVSNMYVATSIPESYVGKLKIGTNVEVYLASMGKMYQGKVRQIGNFINPTNRSFGIEVSVPNPENLLRPNQVAKLKIIDYTASNAIVVPANVVQEDGQKNNFVFTVSKSNGKTGFAKKVLVQVGKTSDSQTEILSGLSANDVVVVEGISGISDGFKLNF